MSTNSSLLPHTLTITFSYLGKERVRESTHRTRVDAFKELAITRREGWAVTKAVISPIEIQGDQDE